MLAVSAPAAAYNIHAKGKHHERMTWLSEKCLADSEGLPEKCEFPANADEFEDISGPTFRRGEYWKAVRWPDDPTRQLDELWTMAKFAGTVQFVCPSLVEEQGFFAGLTCGSHYGQMQFLHAMSSAEDETTEHTRALIEGWSRFSFRVAVGAIEPSENYCESTHRNAGAAATRLAPEGLEYCEARTVDGVNFDAWTVGTLLTFHCDKMFSSKTCDLLVDEDGSLARRSAVGALLHLIQDSYSQAHTGRGEDNPTGPYTPKVECSPVESFYLYVHNEANHSAADRAPYFAESCSSENGTLDPITAGARLLYYVQQGSESEEATIDMILNDVLGGNAS
ncbi:hypothetical protein [Qipengyuania sp.]|uniref:hypothetical protein n=1 Tax=Qipengyuania sp. TaxID=2004515 RepID=UPI003BAD46A9